MRCHGFTWATTPYGSWSPRPCKLQALPQSGYCWHHDPNNEAARRLTGRQRRAIQRKTPTPEGGEQG